MCPLCCYRKKYVYYIKCIYMNETYTWYQSLIKPGWAPPSWLFGPVWTVLYTIIAITFGTVFYKVFIKEIPWMIVLPFVLNLIFNFAFTPLQFGLRNNYLASIDIVFVFGTLIWALVVVWPYMRFAVYINISLISFGFYSRPPYSSL